MGPEGKDVICHRCDYHWVYRGANKFVASCPKCNTSVTIRKSDARLKEKLEAEKTVVMVSARSPRTR